jgi:hypothetical protein
MLLNYILEILNVKFGYDTGCPGRGILWFSSVPPGNAGIVLQMTTSFHIICECATIVRSNILAVI